MPVLPDDLHLGSYSNDGPWSMLQALNMRQGRGPVWYEKAPTLRKEALRSLDRLIEPPRLPPLSRAIRVIGQFTRAFGLWQLAKLKGQNQRLVLAREIRFAAERLGPTYIKLAQIISAGEGVFPDELVTECRLCRDQVRAVDFEQIKPMIEAELNQPLKSVFRSFEPTPLASASIAQVHLATLADNTEVVVKVQKPAIDTLVRSDIKVLAWLAPYLIGRIPIAALANPPSLVELFAETILEELDFRIEAANMVDLAQALSELDQQAYVVPRPHPNLVSRKVLVMERLKGLPFDNASALQAVGVDTEAVLKSAMIGFLEGVYLKGIFHGDLHSGNLMVLEDSRTALLDFGITARLSERERSAFLRMLMSGMTNNVQGQVEGLRDLGALPADTDIVSIIRELGLDSTALDAVEMSPEKLTKELQHIFKTLLTYGARMPKPLMLYVKNMIFIDGAIASLAPDLDLFETMTEIATHFTTVHGQAIADQLGTKNDWQLDLYRMKAGLGVNPDRTHSLSYNELRQRRLLIRQRLKGRKLS